MVLWRDGKEVTLQATLAEKPDDTQLASRRRRRQAGRHGAEADRHLPGWA